MATIPIQISLRKKGADKSAFSCTMSTNDFENFKNVMQGKGALGTRANPLPIGNFLKKDVIDSEEIPDFHWGDELIMEIQGDGPKLLFCELRNTNKDFTNDYGENEKDDWGNIFIKSATTGYTPAPNGSLFIYPVYNDSISNATCAPIQGTNDYDFHEIYISYSIVFSWELSIEGNQKTEKYFFVHDPVIKVSSNTPPPEL
ncbi:hypothetical protein [uncultured Aquimarina sp.]|uniref:hypothetical protein n=1 Tax=uncultured Aquimarina sp. TaxID=575652 RepID=UPI00260D3DB5|nr:hypothetical protein [uncultured Aquimarina sp.]